MIQSHRKIGGFVHLYQQYFIEKWHWLRVDYKQCDLLSFLWFFKIDTQTFHLICTLQNCVLISKSRSYCMNKKNINHDLRKYLENGAVTMFSIYVAVSTLGLIVDFLSFQGVAKIIFFNNLSTICITLISYLLYRFKKLSLKVSFAIILYSAIANVFLGTFNDLFTPVRINFFLRDSFFLVIVFTLAALVINKWHAVAMAVIYTIAAILVAILSGDSFLNGSLPMILLFIATYALLMYYFVGVIDKAIREREYNSELIKEQNNKLTDANTLLKQRQLQIEIQAEELTAQAASLQESTDLLAIKNNELLNLNTTKDKFISILAHDLKSPFNSILGLSELLQNEFHTLKNEDKLKYIETLNSTTKKTYELLENLLQWAIYQSNSTKITATKINISFLIRENMSLLENNFSNKSIQVTDNISDDFFAYADEQMISTVIRNLLSNAMKFTPVGGSININISKNETDILIEISDNGIGINNELHQNLFRIDKTNSRKGTMNESGTGLGLVLCKDFVEKNGGTIWLSSEEGKGTKFSFTVRRFVEK